MRALLVEELLPEFDGCRLAEGLDAPVAGPDEVQVKIRAAALGFPDLLMTHGGYQHKPELPFTPGTEMAGEITALGENVTEFKIGDAVVGGSLGGGLAEMGVFPSGRSSAKVKKERLWYSPSRASSRRPARSSPRRASRWCGACRRAPTPARRWRRRRRRPTRA